MGRGRGDEFGNATEMFRSLCWKNAGEGDGNLCSVTGTAAKAIWCRSGKSTQSTNEAL